SSDCPSKRMCPPLRGSRPMSVRTSVVLPMPLRPISVTNSPSSTVMETPNNTSLEPYPADTSFNSSMRVLQGIAQVVLAHQSAGPHPAPGAAGDFATLRQHADAVGQAEHRVHIVLHQDDGHRPLQPPNE